jgi:predicted nucleotidyltransferase
MGQERDVIISRIKRFLREENIKLAILFGSYARGTEMEGSDVDVMIIDDRFDGLDAIERARISWGLVKDDFFWSADIICMTPEEFESDVELQLAAKDAVEEGIMITP